MDGAGRTGQGSRGHDAPKFYRVTFEPLTYETAERLAEVLMDYLTGTEEHDGGLVLRHHLYEDASATIEPCEEGTYE